MRKSLLLFFMLFSALLLVGCVEEQSFGTIHVSVINLDNEEVYSGEIGFEEEENFLDILIDHEDINLIGELKRDTFEIKTVIGINSDEYTNKYWGFKVNGKDSTDKIQDIVLKDGDEYVFFLDDYGVVVISIFDNEDEEIFFEDLKFKKTDSLEQLLKVHEQIQMKGVMHSFGFEIKEMFGINSDDYEQTFWNIKVDGEDSMVGISLIELVDGSEIGFHLISWE